LKSTLWDMGIATPACLWGLFAWKTFSTLWLWASVNFFFQLDESLVSSIWLGLVFKSNLLSYVSWLGHWGHLHSVLVLGSSCCFHSFLFPCCLVLSIPFLLVSLLKRVYSFLILICNTIVSSSICKSPLHIEVL
jgi:hypothetical protein